MELAEAPADRDWAPRLDTRQVGPEEAETFARIGAAANGDPDRQARTDHVLEWMAEPHHRHYLAYLDGRPVGTIRASSYGQLAYVTSFAVLPELQAFMGDLKVPRADGLIAVRDNGTVWPSEKEMQTRVSHWLRDQERAGHIGAGTTLHGLRVSYAAWWRRNGANTREVADLIGDESERMGAHYTRHVEAEQNIIRAFSRISDRLDNA